MTNNMWTWYINGNELVAKTTPCGDNQPEAETDEMGDYDNINAADALTQQLRNEMRLADSLNLQLPDTLLQIKIGDTIAIITYIFASRISNIPNNVYYKVLSRTYISESEQMIDVLDNNNEIMSIPVDELMHGSNRLSRYNYTGTNDPFYEPYTYYNTLCSNVSTYYVYDHLGNTRITYTPTVMPDGLHYTLNGVYDYYPYGKILREYVQGTQEKYLTTHHERDIETGLDYRGARFYDCDIARFLSLDPLAVKFESWSAYNYVLSNPIMMIDPNGCVAGDYYSENGEHLGSDGKDDDKVYAVSEGSYTKSEAGTVIVTTGITELKNTDGTSFSLEKFKDLAGTLFAEASKNGTWQESAGIYSVMENRAAADGITTHEEAQTGGINGWSRKDDINSPNASAKDVSNAIKGLIMGIQSVTDYSNGAFFWDGSDYSKTSRYTAGTTFSNPTDNIYNLKENKKSGSNKYGSWSSVYQTTNAIGGTVFSKLSDPFRASRNPSGISNWEGR